jgi:hypothetical protein
MESAQMVVNPFDQVRRHMIAKREAARCGRGYYQARIGQAAFVAGNTPVDCPHILGTPEHQAWMSGWLAAFDRRFSSPV